jgi:NAD(P) transhydrogenase
MRRFDLVVIGSGPAGQKAAVQAAKLGKQVAVVEKQTHVGGACIHTGTIPSKTLREAVLDLTGLRQRALYGESFSRGPEVGAADLLQRASLIMKREREVVRAQLHRNHVQVLEGTARFTGTHELCVEGRDATHALRAEKFVIATGSVPVAPPGIAVDHDRVLTSDDVLALEALPRHLVVIGAGIIGIEYATIFAAAGVKVTLVDQRAELLEFVDRELVHALAYQAAALGVTLRLGEAVSRLEVSGTHVVAVLASGKRIAADQALVSAGRRGASSGLGLEALGVVPDPRGRITVDARYRTLAPHVYAVGDVIGAPSLASTGMEQGRLAACDAFGVAATSTPELFPFGIYAVPEIAWVGATEAELTAKGVAFETGVARYREIARGQILGDADGMLKLIFGLEDRRLLGVWILGTQATELVHIGQAVMALGGTLDYFVHGVFNYPTLAECYKVAALDGHNKLRSLGEVERNGAAATETAMAPEPA